MDEDPMPQPKVTVGDDYFGALEVSTLVGCHVRCEFCPQDLYSASYARVSPRGARLLQVGDFQLILDHLRGGPVNRLTFSGYAENFQNPETVELLFMGHQAGFELEVVTTGAGLTVSDIDRLRQLPIVRFALSMQPRGSLRRPGIRDEERLWQVVEYAMESLMNIHIDVVAEPGWDSDPRFESLRDLARARGLHFRVDWHDRAGNLPAAEVARPRRHRLKGRGYCARPLTNVVQPNGDVSLCCMDWSLDHVVGNLLRDSYVDIIGGARMQEVLACLELGQVGSLLCARCHYLETVGPTWVPVAQRPY